MQDISWSKKEGRAWEDQFRVWFLEANQKGTIRDELSSQIQTSNHVECTGPGGQSSQCDTKDPCIVFDW